MVPSEYWHTRVSVCMCMCVFSLLLSGCFCHNVYEAFFCFAFQDSVTDHHDDRNAGDRHHGGEAFTAGSIGPCEGHQTHTYVIRLQFCCHLLHI